jgi:hypothetical protein
MSSTIGLQSEFLHNTILNMKYSIKQFIPQNTSFIQNDIVWLGTVGKQLYREQVQCYCHKL